MYSSIAAILALSPALILAQSSPQNETVLGGFPSDEHAVEYWRASHSANITNAVSFTGYNWSVPIDYSTRGTNSSSTWQLHLNYSRVSVPTRSGNATSGLTMFSLTFPERQWDLNSDWSLCLSMALQGLSISTPGNNSDSSCAPYIGQGCVDGILQALRGAAVSNANVGCPLFPSLSNIPACSNVVKSSNGVGTTVISNTTAPDLVYNSTNFVSATGGTQVYTLDSVPRQGLSSGQGFAGDLTVFGAGDIDAASKAQSERLQMVALTLVPSSEFRNNNTGGYGYQVNPRLICARASVASSASSSIKNAPTAVMISMAVAVVALLVL